MMKSVVSFLFGWAVLVCVIVFSINSTALDLSFYTSRYEEMQLASSLGVSNQDLNTSIEKLLDYIADDRTDIDGMITRYGIKQKTFNERETKHMIDVKALYQNVIKTAWASFALGVMILLYFLIWERKYCLSYLTKGFLQAFLCLGIVLCFFGFWVFYDFTGFWNWFHTIFFTNDLWLLNPATDFMICMLPETIFNQLVLSISVKAILILFTLSIFSGIYQVRKAPIGFDQK